MFDLVMKYGKDSYVRVVVPIGRTYPNSDRKSFEWIWIWTKECLKIKLGKNSGHNAAFKNNVLFCQ